ncbi:HotDog domain-containing protein [Jimgerdemannia flammicorona]|nr:HotDog domain-containing protein [Jimgerdemannia flammicorona]
MQRHLPPDLETKFPMVYRYLQANTGDSFDSTLVRRVNVEEVKEGRMVCSFTPTAADCNLLGSMHGGCIATLVDVCSTWVIHTIQSKHGWMAGGVSTNLHVQYVSAARLGVPLLIESELIKVGKSMANMRVRLMEKETGKVCSVGTHSKFNIDSKL